MINKYHPAVFAVSETWLKTGSYFRMPGYSCLRDDRHDGKASAAILVDCKIPFSQIIFPAHNDGFQMVAIKAINISFISIYPNLNIISEIQTILKSSLTGKIFIFSDFICHHFLWGSNHCCSNSVSLHNLLDDLNVCVCYDGSATHRVPLSQNKSCY